LKKDSKKAVQKAVTNDPKCCAERRLVRDLVRDAARHGMRPCEVVRWVRRKTGNTLTVWRHLGDGTLGNAVPCCLCRDVILQFGFRVHCSLGRDAWFRGYMDEPGAPASKLTGMQRNRLRGL
jgi:hypothetical protein